MEQCIHEYGDDTSDDGSFKFCAFILLNNSKFSMFLKVTEYHSVPEFDIAILRYQVPTEHWDEWLSKFPLTSLLPPSPGSKIYALGYPNAKIFDVDKNKSNLEVELVRSEGFVEENHPVQRDSSMLNFPCFRFNAKVSGGMSGAPIFNENGNVCGVVCSGTSFSDNNEEGHISYGVPLWPACGIGFIEQGQRIYRFYDVYKSNFLQSTDINKVYVIHSHEKVAVYANYEGTILRFFHSHQ